MKLIRLSLITLMILFLHSGFTSGDIMISIDVSPSVINLQSNGQVVTVHTDIKYSLVSGSTVTLNGIEISWWKSDDRGFFVAKFQIDDIKNLPLNIGEYNTLTLSGITCDGTMFSGSQEIKVINVVPAGKK